MPDQAGGDAGVVAKRVFGDRLPLAERYADLLRGPGVERGLIGPREGDRVWERHLLNSAVLAELVPDGSSVVDVGSGAGLPGIPLALARPDLDVVLVEPMLRRITFLEECVAALGIDRVSVLRGRAEDVVDLVRGEVVVARALARLEKLLGWTLPLVAPGGRILAVKGASVGDELTELGVTTDPGTQTPHRRWVRRGVDSVELREAGCGIIDPPATVVCVTRTPGQVRRPRG